MNKYKNALFPVISCSISLLLSILAAESLLRIWRPPQISMRGTNILLSKNTTFENKKNFHSPKIQNRIIIRKNSLGFRGPEPPIDFSKKLTIITVGGSTTECFFNTEGKTWTDVLSKNLQPLYPGIWINNAGINGHSTFGHIKLMEQHIINIHPKYVIFLMGINDMALEEENDYDKNIPVASPIETSTSTFWQKLNNKSMILSLIQYIKSKKGSHKITSEDRWITDFGTVSDENVHNPITQVDIALYVTRLTNYKARLKTLVALSKDHSIKPIFVTQPVVFGSGFDDETGLNLEKMIVSDFFTGENVRRNGKDAWQILEYYNSVTKEVAKEADIPVIDLAHELPKSSKYYYDFIHFTDAGNEKIGEILAKQVLKIIN